MATIIGYLHAVLTADTQPFDVGMRQARNEADKFNSVIDKVKGTAAALGITLSVGLFANHIAQTADAIEANANLAGRVGTTAATMETLSFAAKSSGMDVAGFATNVQFLEKNLGNAAINGGATVDMLRRYGLTVRDLTSVPVDQQLGIIADKMAGIHDPAERAAFTTALFGKSSLQMIDVLGKGSATLRKAQDDIESLGGALSAPEVEGVKAMNDEIDKMKEGVSLLWQDLTALLAPGITTVLKIINWGIGIVRGIYNWMQSWGEGAKTVAKIIGGVLVGALVAFAAQAAIARVRTLALAAAKAVMLAMSGPPGWAALAIGVAAAGVAIYALTSEVNSVSGSLSVGAESAGEFGSAMEGAAGDAEKMTKTLSELDKYFAAKKGVAWAPGDNPAANAQKQIDSARQAIEKYQAEIDAAFTRAQPNLAPASGLQPWTDAQIQKMGELKTALQDALSMQKSLQEMQSGQTAYEAMNAAGNASTMYGAKWDTAYNIGQTPRELETQKFKEAQAEDARQIGLAAAKAGKGQDYIDELLKQVGVQQEGQLKNFEQLQNWQEDRTKQKAVTDMTTKMRESLDTIGMTADELEIYKAKLNDADAGEIAEIVSLQSQRKALTDAAEARKRANETIDNTIKSLREQAAVAGITEQQKQISALTGAGATPDKMAEAYYWQGVIKLREQAAAAAQATENDVAGIIRDNAQAMQDAMTPMEKYEERIGHLNALAEAGKLPWDEYKKAVGRARTNLETGVAAERQKAADTSFQVWNRNLMNIAGISGAFDPQVVEQKRTNDLLDQVVVLLRTSNQKLTEATNL